MLKKMGVTGILIAAAAGTVLTGTAAIAQPTGGWGHFHNHFRAFSRNGDWNGNENHARNHIHIRIRNRNNNVAVARNEQAQRQRDRFREQERRRRRLISPELCRAGGGIPRFVNRPVGTCVGGIFDGFPVRLP